MGGEMKRLMRSMAAASWLLCLAAPALAADVSTFKFKVPRRTLPQFEISALKLTIQLDDSTPIRLSIASPHGTRETQIMTLTNGDTDCFDGTPDVCFVDFDAPGGASVGADSLVIVKPMHAGADPASADNRKLVVFFQLTSNINETVALCPSTMPVASEEWTVSVVAATNPATDRIQGVALQSLDRKAAGVCPSTTFRPIPPNDGPVATVTAPAPEFTSGRVGLDTVLVLDRSGSMVSKDGGGSTDPNRLDRLKTATNSFLAMWNTLRSTETTGLVQSPTDRVGIVFFDHAKKWITGDAMGPGSKMVEFNAAALPGLTAGVNGVSLGGSTSIGKGLLGAVNDNALPDAGGATRRVLLLMTDGAQNTPEWAFACGNKVVTEATSTPDCTPPGESPSLPRQPFQVYTVTVGKEFGPDAPINQQLATATGAYTLNTTQPAAELDAFFLQTLQNYHKFSTLETMRIIQDRTSPAAPFQTELPVTSATTRLAFSLSSSSPFRAPLSLVLVPPGGGTPITFTGALPIIDGFRLPLQGAASSAGVWSLRVIASHGDVAGGTWPFGLVVMGDDATINTSVGVVGTEHAVGQEIRLTAQVNDFTKTLKGLGSQPGAVVKAFAIKPGNSVGDVLSDSAVNPGPPPPGDNATPAQRKMAAILEQDPNALPLVPGEVILRDDGAGADARANDGVYSASVPAELEGHYKFVFSLGGDAESGGRFVRQQIRTVHVRSLPDAENTTQTTSVTQTPGGPVVTAVLTPRNVRGGKMGPGWANYFWFKAPGAAPVKPVDNLNGTYTAQVPFTGPTPPDITVHFLPEPVPRPDDFVPQQGDLTPGNEIQAGQGGGGRNAIWLGLGLTFPHGSFANDSDSGFAGALGYERSLQGPWSVEAILGVHRFAGQAGAVDTDVTHFGLGAKRYLGQGSVKAFATAGLGLYAFDPGSTRFGFNGGIGVQGRVAPRLSIEGRWTLHGVTDNSPQSRYSTLLAGLRYAF
jgi:hypothetical protein